MTIGAGFPVVAPATSSSSIGPIYRSSANSNLNSSRHAYLYTAAELGIPPGASITGLAWLKADGATITGNNTFNVLLNNTTQNVLSDLSTWGSLTPGATTVYSSTTHTFTGAAGTFTGIATTPYVYTGGNLLVLMDWLKQGTASARVNFVANAAPDLAIGNATSALMNNATILYATFGDRRATIRITYTLPPACTSPPTAGTAVASPANGCRPFSTLLSLTGSTAGSGQSYQWQQSNNGVNFTDISGATSYFYQAAGLLNPTWFRAQVSCSGLTATSAAVRVDVFAPTYASLPINESFETPWSSVCGNREIPNASWRNTFVRFDNSWRRNDDGAAAVWSGNVIGEYVPASSHGTYSARFHSYNAALNTPSALDLYVDLSASGPKVLQFDYVNNSGTDRLDVLISTDGGTSYAPVSGGALTTSNGFRTYVLDLPSNLTATCVLRFQATTPVTSSDDIGLDNVRIFAINDLPSLVTSGAQAVSADNFFNVTVPNGSTATLSGAIGVYGTLTVAGGGTLITNCQPLTGPANVVVAAGATLQVCDATGLSVAGTTTSGAFRTTGTRMLSSDASYIFNGTAAQITGFGLPNQVRNLTAANTAGLTLSQPTSVARIVALTTAGNLISNGNLTLLSDATATALVTQSGSGSVTGATTVQRYLSPGSASGLGYRHMSAPVTNTTVADLAVPGRFVPLVNPLYNTAPGTLPAASFPNVFGYSETRLPASTQFVDGYFSPTDLSDPLTSGRGFSVYLPAEVGGTPVIPDFVGTLGNGPVPLTLTRTGTGSGNQKTGWHLLGNPYPAPIDWDFIPNSAFPANMSHAVSVFKSTGRSGGSYLTRLNNGIGTLPDGEIPMAQGFFVKVANGASATFSLENAYRVSTYTNPAHYRTATDTRPLVELGLRAAAPGAAAATTIVYAEAGATAAVDNLFDAAQPAHNTGPVPTLLSLAPTGEELVINGQAPADWGAGLQVPLLLDLPATGAYLLEANQVLNIGTGFIGLHDALTGTTTDLLQQPAYAFTATTAGELRGRFSLVLRPGGVLLSAGATVPLIGVDLVPNPATGAVQLRLTRPATSAFTGWLRDALGRVIRPLAIPAGTQTATLDLSGLAGGVYSLSLITTDGQTISRRLVVE